jgi:hypothetical protein
MYLRRWVFAIVFSVVLTALVALAQPQMFNFDADAAGKAPGGFTSYATGGGPAGKWVVTEMNDAPSGKLVVVNIV